MTDAAIRLRSASAPSPWGEFACADCTVPGCPVEVVLLVKAILDRKRGYPIVVLTARRGESAPALAPADVRGVVGANVPVYFVRGCFAACFAEGLPVDVQVWGGAARVYWPGVTDDPWGHPLLHDPEGVYGVEVLERLGRIFKPGIAREADLSPRERVVVLERELRRVRFERSRDLGVLRARYEGLLLGEPDTTAPRALRIAICRRGGLLPDLEVEFRCLVGAHWAAYLPKRFKSHYPLREYTVTPGFLADVARRVGRVPVDRVGWVCALVACGYSPRGSGLSYGPLREGPEAPQMVREGGEAAWWCNLRRKSTPGQGPRVLYWQAKNGPVEFFAVGYPARAVEDVGASGGGEGRLGR